MSRVRFPQVDLGMGYEVDKAKLPSPMCIGSQDGMEEQDPHRDHVDLSTTGSLGTREDGHSMGYSSGYEDENKLLRGVVDKTYGQTGCKRRRT